MKASDPLLEASEHPTLLGDQLGVVDSKRHRDSSHTSTSTSGEEGYDSINSDEELQAGEEAAHHVSHPVLTRTGLSVISSGRLFAKPQDVSPSPSPGSSPNAQVQVQVQPLSCDSEDSGVNRDGPASLGSSIGSSSGSPPTFQELKVTSYVVGSASPKRATFTIGTPKQLSIESPEDPAPYEEPGSPAAAPPQAGAEDKEEELRRAQQELRLRDEEVTRLSRIREQVESELEDLTASLFQEAHNMVRDANTRQASAERSLAEARMQVEVLTAEVAALKTLVLTSTPARPNPHLHPQIDKTRSCDDNGGGGLFRKHRRSPSHFNLKYGRENSPPDSPVRDPQPHSQSAPTGTLPCSSVAPDQIELREGLEVDPTVHRDFLSWRQCPTTDKSHPFVARVYREDIDLCLDFNNVELAERVCRAVETGNIYIEAVGDRTKTAFPKKCALLEAPRQCHYRMKLGDQDTWYCISQLCRNRITAVIDFLNYLRYVERGLVKSSAHDIYYEIVKLRKEMCLARLGLALSS